MHYTREELEKVIRESTSLREVLIKLEMSPKGSSYKRMRNILSDLKIDTAHFLGFNRKVGRTVKKLKLEDIFDNTVKIASNSLKRKLLKLGLMEYRCIICGISEYNNEYLSLHLDHVDGNSENNAFDNLRLLCPNCHSQTDTFAGRNKKTAKNNSCQYCKNPIFNNRRFCKNCILEKRHLYYEGAKKRTTAEHNRCSCGKEISSNASTCKSCVPRETKITWPSEEEMAKLIWAKSTVQIARDLGVSDKAVEKFCKKKGIAKPPRGYWQQLQHEKIDT